MERHSTSATHRLINRLIRHTKFLYATLHEFGFVNQNTIQLNMLLLGQIIILLRGSPSPPSLFAIFIELLAVTIWQNNNIKSHFADDVLFFFSKTHNPLFLRLSLLQTDSQVFQTTSSTEPNPLVYPSISNSRGNHLCHYRWVISII